MIADISVKSSSEIYIYIFATDHFTYPMYADIINVTSISFCAHVHKTHTHTNIHTTHTKCNFKTGMAIHVYTFIFTCESFVQN